MNEENLKEKLLVSKINKIYGSRLFVIFTHIFSLFISFTYDVKFSFDFLKV